MKKAFTLAEIMIALTVIGVLTAVLLPSAKNLTANEDVIKFKKGYKTFYTVIRELVTSDKYYLDGDLGMRADGSYTSIYENDILEATGYFCATFGDLINAKEVNCSSVNTENKHGHSIYTNECSNATTIQSRIECNGNVSRDADSLLSSKKGLENACKKITDLSDYSHHLLPDGTVFWELNAYYTFGIRLPYNSTQLRWYSSPNEPPTFYDNAGRDVVYKGFCMDIDGINNGEDPFGFAVRADGKILNGARVDEWLEKDTQ